jgi:hypothetical protein
VANFLRAEDLDASPAQVVDAVRLAETVASFRGRRHPGLLELNDATQATARIVVRTVVEELTRKLESPTRQAITSALNRSLRSMAASGVYAGGFGAVLASIPAVSTKMVVFDTAVVNLTENLK